MKKTAILGAIIFFLWCNLLIINCTPSTPPSTGEEEQEKPDKYKKGDIVCVVEFGVKGIVQYRNISFGANEPVYSVMFNNKYDELYNLNIYESQLTECQ